jgi:hypothetical protein
MHEKEVKWKALHYAPAGSTWYIIERNINLELEDEVQNTTRIWIKY